MSLTSLYQEICPSFVLDEEYNTLILNRLNELFDIEHIDVNNFWRARSLIKIKIRERAYMGSNMLWMQPIIMLLYPLIAHYKRKVIEQWIDGKSLQEIQKIYTDLGIQYESR